MATSHFYDDTQLNVDGDHMQSQVLLATFYLWFVVEVVKVATQFSSQAPDCNPR